MNPLEFGWMFSYRFLNLCNQNGDVIRGLGSGLRVANAFQSQAHLVGHHLGR